MYTGEGEMSRSKDLQHLEKMYNCSLTDSAALSIHVLKTGIPVLFFFFFFPVQK